MTESANHYSIDIEYASQPSIKTHIIKLINSDQKTNFDSSDGSKHVHLHLHIEGEGGKDIIDQIKKHILIEIQGGVLGDLTIEEKSAPVVISGTTNSSVYNFSGARFFGNVVQDISTTTSGISKTEIIIHGGVGGDIKTINGDVKTDGDISGSVNSSTGNVNCTKSVKGGVSTSTGNATIGGDVGASATSQTGDVTVSGNVAGSVSSTMGSVKVGSNDSRKPQFGAKMPASGYGFR